MQERAQCHFVAALGGGCTSERVAPLCFLGTEYPNSLDTSGIQIAQRSSSGWAKKGNVLLLLIFRLCRLVNREYVPVPLYTFGAGSKAKYS